MTEEMLITQKEEQRLMGDWEKWWQEHHKEYPCFNRDGIVSYEDWEEIPAGKRILVVLKETNALEGSLAEFLRNGGSDTYYRTWNNVARWTRMILDGIYLEQIHRETLDRSVKEIAVMNLKKYAGDARAHRGKVRKAALEDKELLRRQIRLIQPDIVLAGGWGLVSDLLHDHILKEDCPWYDPRIRKDPEYDPDLWYFRTDHICQGKSVPVISMPHPNRAAKKWTLELQKVFVHMKKEGGAAHGTSALCGGTNYISES